MITQNDVNCHTSCAVPMMTSSNGDIFRVTVLLYEEFTGPGEFTSQRPMMRSFDVFFDLCLNKQLSIQSRPWWFQTSSCSLWRSVMMILITKTRAHHPLHADSTTLIYLPPDGNQTQLKNIPLRYQTGVPICKQNKCFTDKFCSWWEWGLKRPSWRLSDRRPLSNRSQIFRFRSAVDQAWGL